MITIAQLWQEFLTTTYSSGLNQMSPNQRRELRLSFYAGFYKALTSLADIGKDNDAERAGVVIGNYIEEWKQFAYNYLQERQEEQ